jgi:hypothetical protein
LGPDYLFYETTATIITVVLLGNLLEQKSVQQTTSSIRELGKLRVHKAKVILSDSKGVENIQEIETELVKNLPVELIHKAHHWLILHGRYICIARNPKCQECGLRPACRYYQQSVI